jgi:hypothetical protein
MYSLHLYIHIYIYIYTKNLKYRIKRGVMLPKIVMAANRPCDTPCTLGGRSKASDESVGPNLGGSG